MNIFRIFFVSTALIPIILVAATADENGLRIRRPRNVVISEDGTRRARRHNPVNITDVNCPSLGCTGAKNSANNGKGSIAALQPKKLEGFEEEFTVSNNQRRLFNSSATESSSSSSSSSSFHHHPHPLKLEIKSIKNSTRSDLVNSSQIFFEDSGTGRGIISTAVVVSWAIYYIFKVIVSLIVFIVIKYCWSLFTHKKYWGGWGEVGDYVETFVKLGKDNKHPFGHYGSGWNPQFGISLKSKVVDDKDKDHGWGGWSGWPSHPGGGWPGHGWPGWSSGWGWPVAHGWGGGWPSHQPHHHHHHPGHDLGWKSSSEEKEDELKNKFDMLKGWKIAQKHTKRYGKKAHKYGLRPSKYAYMFDKDGNIVLGGKGQGFAWRRRKRSVLEDILFRRT